MENNMKLAELKPPGPIVNHLIPMLADKDPSNESLSASIGIKGDPDEDRVKRHVRGLTFQPLE